MTCVPLTDDASDAPARGHYGELVKVGRPGLRGPHGGMRQAARRRTSQTVAAMSSPDSASSQPPSMNWNAQYRLAGW